MAIIILLFLSSCIFENNATLSVSSLEVDLEDQSAIDVPGNYSLSGSCSPANSIITLNCGGTNHETICKNGNFSAQAVQVANVPAICTATISNGRDIVSDDEPTLALADILIKIEADKEINETYVEEEIITYSIIAENIGNLDATNVALNFQCPTGTTLSSSLTQDGVYDNNPLIGLWNIGDIEENETSKTLNVQCIVNIGSAGSSINSEVLATNVSLDQNEFNTSNNGDIKTHQISNSSDLTLSVNVNDNNPSTNQDVVFTLTLDNIGEAPARNISVTKQCPGGTSYQSHIASQGTYLNSTGVWSLGDQFNQDPNAPNSLAITCNVNSNQGGNTISLSTSNNDVSIGGGQVDVVATNEVSSTSISMTPMYVANNDVITDSESGLSASVNVASNDTFSSCTPITYSLISSSNAVVTNTAETFNYTPSSGGPWTFSYNALCGDGTTMSNATVSGNAVSIVTIDDHVSGTGVGLATSQNISINDTAVNCGTISYTIDSQTNVSISGTAPNLSITPTDVNWEFDYSATCANTTSTDGANVSGTAASITTLADSVSGTTEGVASIYDVSINDSSTGCTGPSYSTQSLVNVSLSGTPPNFQITPIVAGNWSFDYIASCQNVGISSTSAVSGNAAAPTSITANNDILGSSYKGIEGSINVASNDTSTTCSPITYTLSSPSNVTVGGTAPNYTYTPTNSGAWQFTYEAKCSDNTTLDTAIVSGTATLPSLDLTLGNLTSSLYAQLDPSTAETTGDMNFTLNANSNSGANMLPSGSFIKLDILATRDLDINTASWQTMTTDVRIAIDGTGTILNDPSGIYATYFANDITLNNWDISSMNNATAQLTFSKRTWANRSTQYWDGFTWSAGGTTTNGNSLANNYVSDGVDFYHGASQTYSSQAVAIWLNVSVCSEVGNCNSVTPSVVFERYSGLVYSLVGEMSSGTKVFQEVSRGLLNTHMPISVSGTAENTASSLQTHTLTKLGDDIERSIVTYGFFPIGQRYYYTDSTWDNGMTSHVEAYQTASNIKNEINLRSLFHQGIITPQKNALETIVDKDVLFAYAVNDQNNIGGNLLYDFSIGTTSLSDYTGVTDGNLEYQSSFPQHTMTLGKREQMTFTIKSSIANDLINTLDYELNFLY